MTEPISLDGRSPRLSLPFLYPAQAQKEHLINETIAKLDCLVSPMVAGEAASPPISPSDGDAYIVSSGASDDWAGREDHLAYWADNQWLFVAPSDGLRVYDAALAQFVFFANGWKRATRPAVPQGGSIIDIEARNAILDLIEALANTGVFSQS